MILHRIPTSASLKKVPLCFYLVQIAAKRMDKLKHTSTRNIFHSPGISLLNELVPFAVLLLADSGLIARNSLILQEMEAIYRILLNTRKKNQLNATHTLSRNWRSIGSMRRC